SNKVWLDSCNRILSEATDPFVPENQFDRQFLSIINICRETSFEGLFKIIWQAVCKMKDQSLENYNNFVNYFAKYPLWGTLDPARHDYDTLKRRATVLKQHSYDFMWLYRRFPDYLSKQTITAILLNWLTIDPNMPHIVKSIFPDYYEPDIFPNNKDDIFVDIGAYTGDSILNYVKNYGADYKRIYAYEITESSCEIMRRTLKDLRDVEIRRKGVGEKAGEMFLNPSDDPSANQISSRSSKDRVEIVTLDDDLPDGFTFLKMDIEGAEYNALRGSEQTIRRCRPKLAVCVYHGYDDIWRIPALIDSIDPNYQFYLRHNGGNLIPTEFVLLAKPLEK
ncbi:MAG: FkbM family methyltransferase, partial [Oscillospiraceae bacterium]|nr:FkbM family methyltransferase [Oscillospiraceae bacterium]